MNADRITKRLVDQLQPTAKDVLVFDTTLKGFVLKVTPTGAKTYLIRYRMGGRATPLRSVTIGKHGSPWTPDQARKEAELLLAKVAQGVDPVEERKARLAKAFSVSELADRYLLQHVDMKNKASTQKEFRRIVESIIKPALGALPCPQLPGAISRRCTIASGTHRGKPTTSFRSSPRCSTSLRCGASGQMDLTHAG